MVDEFYSTDDDVKNDAEIQSWSEDVHTNAFPGGIGVEESQYDNSFPKELTTKKKLTEYCTLIIFWITGSVQHASINFGQYDMYAFVLNSPATLCQPPLSKKKLLITWSTRGSDW